jgi:predicted nucleotidyltransferase
MQKLTRAYILEHLRKCFSGKSFGKFRLMFYGSWAYGSPHKFSDIDILADTEDDFTNKEAIELRTQIQVMLDKYLIDNNIGFGRPIDILITKRADQIKYVLDRWEKMEVLSE